MNIKLQATDQLTCMFQGSAYIFSCMLESVSQMTGHYQDHYSYRLISQQVKCAPKRSREGAAQLIIEQNNKRRGRASRIGLNNLLLIVSLPSQGVWMLVGEA